MKKFLLRSAALLLLCCFIAGCGTQSRPPAAPTGSDGQQVHTIKVLGPFNPAADVLFTEREEYPVWGMFMDLLDKGGVSLDFEVVPRDQYELVVQTRMASATDLPDLVQLTPLDMLTAVNLGKSGIIQDVMPILNRPDAAPAKNYLTENYDFMFKANTTPEGPMYWVTAAFKRSYGNDFRSSCQLMTIRKDWIDLVGMEMPKTANDFYLALKAFREFDVNGNGIEDEFLHSSVTNFYTGIAQWYGLPAWPSSLDLYNKKAISPWYQPGVKDYFAFMQLLVEENLLDVSLIGAPGEQLDQKVANNQIAALNTYISQGWFEPSVIDPNTEPMYVACIINEPVSGRTTPAIMEEPPFLTWNRYAFTNKADPAAAAALLNIIWTDEYRIIAQWGVEGYTYDIVDGEWIPYSFPGGNAQRKETRGATLNNFVQNFMLPSSNINMYETEINQVRDRGHGVKAETIEVVMSLPISFSDAEHSYRGMPNEQQLEEKNAILADLTTYSSELITRLILGQSSLNDWDKYMADFDRLKLPRLLEIDQELHDAFNNF